MIKKQKDPINTISSVLFCIVLVKLGCNSDKDTGMTEQLWGQTCLNILEQEVDIR